MLPQCRDFILYLGWALVEARKTNCEERSHWLLGAGGFLESVDSPHHSFIHSHLLTETSGSGAPGWGQQGTGHTLGAEAGAQSWEWRRSIQRGGEDGEQPVESRFRNAASDIIVCDGPCPSPLSWVLH